MFKNISFKTLVIFLLAAGLLFSACSPKTNETAAQENAQQAAAQPQSVSQENSAVGDESAALADPMAAAAVEKADIVVSMVELEEGQYISKITLFVTEELLNSDVYVNNSQSDVLIEKNAVENSVSFDLVSGLNISEATITFQLGDSLLATCMLSVRESITPSGDCGW